MNIQQLERELQDAYGFSRISEIHKTVEDAMKGFYKYRDPHLGAEPFVACVFDEWNHLGVTLISCGDNNMGQWVELVMEPNLTEENFLDPGAKE